MEADDSVAYWVDRLRTGDAVAADHLWERYFRHMVELARQKLCRAPCHWADEEDVALSAFKSFCHGAATGRFPDSIHRGNLWQLLFTLTARKAVDLVRHETRQKRNMANTARDIDMDGLAGREFGPDFTVQLEEQYHRLLDSLGDEQLRAVAQWKMEGFTSGEIASRLGCAERTVERKLRVIRRLWEEEADL